MIGHKKKMKFVQEKKKSLLALIIILGLLCIPPVLMASFVLAFDLNDHKGRIAEVLSTQLDRKIQILGRVSWHFSRNGRVGIDATDITIEDLKGASRPLMLHAHRAQLDLDMQSFFEKKLDIVGIKFFAADVSFEINSKGKENWKLSIQDKKEKFEPFFVFQSDIEEERKKKAFFPIELHVGKVELFGSRIAVKTSRGSLALDYVPYVAIEQEEGGSLRVHYKGELGGLPFEADIAGSSFADLSQKTWPFNLKGLWGKTGISAQGRVAEKFKRIAFDQTIFSAGHSEIKGHFVLSLEEKRPLLEGDMKAAIVDPADYIVPMKNAEGVMSGLMQIALRHRMGKTFHNVFSHETFELAPWRGFDMELNLDFDRFYWGMASFDKMKAHMVMADGQLFLSPYSAVLGGSAIKGQTHMDMRTNKLAIKTIFYGKGIEFAKLFNINGMESFISGQVDMDFTFQGEGRSLYELVAKGKGGANLLMDSGTLSSSHLRMIAGSVMDMFLPGARSVIAPGINCMAARYRIEDGLIKTQGFLLDMETTTVAGRGDINLPDELINMSFFTRPKGVGVGAMLPPMRVFGPLFSPEVLFDTKGVMHKMAQYISGSENQNSSVPTMLHIKGKNDCAVTLDNPVMAQLQNRRESTILSPTGGGSGFLGAIRSWFGGIIENLGNQFLGG